MLSYMQHMHSPGAFQPEEMPGYKCFRHQGTVLLYQVTEEDVEATCPQQPATAVVSYFLGSLFGSFLHGSII